MPSPRQSKIIMQRWKVGDEFRQATEEWEDAGLFPGAKSANSATEIYRYGRPIPRRRECYYPETHGLGGEIGSNLEPVEVQNDRAPHLRQLP